MPRRILAALALVPLLSMPALSQQTPAPAPAPAPQVTPEATDSNLQTKPKLITPARKSNCGGARQVMS
ncbi:hypothetical protein [Paracoccus spongiarum]|uniref:Uncharacterized protein n=1 Tax=Paracoccus spongiarum TaxID=3064387 RepID=A0ABT9JB47_9RHOB|nr:hypothetical protein [Paracoccus sp. 2205BS29-5]MDP5306919.1 hypothetical protein [Paracoccus sp. 2205BS29-5]